MMYKLSKTDDQAKSLLGSAPGIRSRLPFGFTVSVDEQAHDQLPKLVESVTFGADGLLYRRLDVALQLQRFNQPVFFHALIDDQLVGAYVLDKRDLLVFNQAVTAYYRGVLAVSEAYQRLGIGKSLALAALAWIEKQPSESTMLSYGCIDKNNVRSLQLLKTMGAVEVAGLSMYMMYKQWPKPLNDVQRLDELSQEQWNELQMATNNDYQLRDISRPKSPVFVLKDTDGAVIFASASVTRFSIRHMGAAARWCTRLFVTPFAAARRRFNPIKFSYVSFSAVSIRAGSEKLWPQFVSSILYEHQCHFAVVYVDPQSHLFAQLQSSGWLNRWVHSSQDNISILMHTATADSDLVKLANSRTIMGVWPVDS